MKMQRLVFGCVVIIGVLYIVGVLPVDVVDCSRTTDPVACRGNRGYQVGNGGGARGHGGIGGRNGVQRIDIEPHELSYTVDDDMYGTHFTHQQNSDGETVNGEYTVLLPDGRTQIVTYTADGENGFRSDVRFEGEPTLEESKLSGAGGLEVTRSGEGVETQGGWVGDHGGFRMSIKYCNKLENECVGVTFDSSA